MKKLNKYILLFACLIGSSINLQAQSKLTMDDMRSFTSVGTPVISPDGKSVLYTFSESNSRTQNIWLIDVEKNEKLQITHGDFSDSSPQWSPDGRKIAFLSNREEGGRSQQIWLVNITGENLRKLTNEDTGIINMEWSVDGSMIAYKIRKRTTQSEIVTIADNSQHNEYLYWVDLGTGESHQVNSEALSGIEYSWSPNGSEMAVSIQKDPGFYGRFESDLYLFDLEKGTQKTLIARPGMERLPRWSPDGKFIAFLTTYGREGGLLPNIGPGVLNLDNNQINDIGKQLDAGGFFEGPTRLVWGPDGQNLYYNVNYRGDEHIIRANIESNVVDIYSDGPMTYGGMSVANEADAIAFLISDYDDPYDIYYSKLSNFNPVKLTDTNTHIEKLAFPSGEMISWTSRDGTEINGLLVKPPAFDPNIKYPLIVSLHGGPASGIGVGFPSFAFFNPFRDELLAAEDYIVLLPNFRGSGGFGLAFRSAIKKDWGKLPYEDVVSGVDHLIGQGFIDDERLGVMGWSYGGYLAAFTITQTDRFKAAAVGAGVTDLIGHYGMLPEQMIEYLEGNPWEESARPNYINSSPIMFADQISTPTFFIHGEDDNAVSISQAEELYAALKTLEVETQFARYPNQGHSFFGKEVQNDSYQRVLDWFNSYLK